METKRHTPTQRRAIADYDDEYMMADCQTCGGEAEFIGTLGRARHYRCRRCGWTAGYIDDEPSSPSRI